MFWLRDLWSSSERRQEQEKEQEAAYITDEMQVLAMCVSAEKHMLSL